jgi:hypothetical protein
MMQAITSEEGIPEDFHPVDSHVRCLAHIINLAVKAGMKEFKMPDVDPDAMAGAEIADRWPLKKVSGL